jgi:hypothetical protein
MSATNGHVPDGATIATLEMLRAANTAYRKLPKTSERLGQDVVVRIQAIRAVTYWQCLPAQPPESKAWPESGPERGAAYQAWRDSLEPEALAAQRKKESETAERIVVAGVVEPTLTLETAKSLGDDIDFLSQEILIFSGLLVPEPVTEAAG